LTETEKNQILDYKLFIYVCQGNDKEKLDWFKIINIAGEKLTDQELRNAVYSGPWLTNAKSIFSKTNCSAYNFGKNYVKGSPIRQDILATALDWMSKGKIEEYMSKHQMDKDANQLWLYFMEVILWVKETFIVYRKNMKGINWGKLYDEFHQNTYDTEKLEEEIKRLMLDDDVTNKSGIYPYVLTRDEKYLNIRAFSESQKIVAYEKQNGICPICHNHFELKNMEGDHITPWSEGGKTTQDNCQMLCKDCNRRKSNK
jgi:hypothetical protein